MILKSLAATFVACAQLLSAEPPLTSYLAAYGTSLPAETFTVSFTATSTTGYFNFVADNGAYQSQVYLYPLSAVNPASSRFQYTIAAASAGQLILDNTIQNPPQIYQASLIPGEKYGLLILTDVLLVDILSNPALASINNDHVVALDPSFNRGNSDFVRTFPIISSNNPGGWIAGVEDLYNEQPQRDFQDLVITMYGVAPTELVPEASPTSALVALGGAAVVTTVIRRKRNSSPRSPPPNSFRCLSTI
jgi:hypothetical protein